MQAVLIGAGKIGRGIIGEVLYNAGYKLTFADVSNELVSMINSYKKYPVFVLSDTEKEEWIENVDAYYIGSEKSVEVFAKADIVTTAVGAGALKKVAKHIAAGIKKRCEQSNTNYLTVIACENMECASTYLQAEVINYLSHEEVEFCHKYISFPDCEVSRMVIPLENASSKNPLAVKVEKYMEWIIDSNKLKADLSHIQNLECSADAFAYIKRKIYTLTGHAILSYMGYQKGYRYIYQAAFDENIFENTYYALSECGKSWSEKFNMDIDEFNLYTTIMLRRFSDTRLKDPIERVAGQPIRKLSINERFISPALTALEYGINPQYIVRGMTAAFKYDNPKDEQAVELQDMINGKGIRQTVQQVCQLKPDSCLYKMIIDAYGG